MQTYRVRARNTAPDSENRIHDDRTAALHGFRAGLVPGVTIYGYLAVPVIERFGEDWLARGGMRVRFLQPVYDGEEVVVDLSENHVTASHDGMVCAAGEIFWPEDAPPSLELYPEEPLPAVRPAASAESLAPGRVFGTLYVDLSLRDHEYPAALLALSNHLLIENVKLGPGFTPQASSAISASRGMGTGFRSAAAWRSVSSAKAIDSWCWTSSSPPVPIALSNTCATRRFTSFALAPTRKIERYT
jgi:hypothetical protein